MELLVYLYELDSQRNSPWEIAHGQAALFEEIVANGNRVALTFNQLTDSQAFLAAVRDRQSYESILALFRAGTLRVSQFGALRTASQYIQGAIERCLEQNNDAFLFSGLAVRCTEQPLLRELLAALRYSDPARLALLAAQSPAADAERMDYILRYVRMILQLSVEPLASNPAKTVIEWRFTDILRRLFAALEQPQHDDALPAALPQALALLRTLQAGFLSREGDAADALMQNRTNWVRPLALQPQNEAAQLAEAIIDLCYNYTMEMSIEGVSLHYQPDDDASFSADAAARLSAYWQSHLAGHHPFCRGDNDAPPEKYAGPLPPWTTAARLVQATGRRSEAQPPQKQPVAQHPCYEAAYAEGQRRWQRHTAGNMGFRLGAALLYILLFGAVDAGLSLLEDSLAQSTLQWQLGAPAIAFLGILCFGIAGSLIGNALHLPDILESVQSIGLSAVDGWRMLHTTRGAAYRHPAAAKTMKGGPA